MPKSKKLYLVFLLMCIAVIQAIAQDSIGLTKSNDSLFKIISQDEAILYNMINDMRRQNKLSIIPLSEALSIVAHVHLNDLIVNKPQDNGCSVQAWSKSDKWTSCCNTKDAAGIKCMTSKPKEITGYKGNGYELAYWGEEKATPADASSLWQQANASADMILSRGKWKGFQWKAIGVGIKDGYALLWLGDKIDKTAIDNAIQKNEIGKTENDTAKVSQVKETKNKKDVLPIDATKGNVEINKPTTVSSATKYYLIVLSTKRTEIAESELNKIKSSGYPDAFILNSQAGYRIALTYYDTAKKAAAKVNELKSTFPGIWVLKE